jgi:uncharacterized phage protein gp47/JayE
VQQLYAQNKAYFNARLGGGLSLLRWAFSSILSAVLAQSVNDLYAWLETLVIQVTPAGAKRLVLDAWAGVFGLKRKSAAYARGTLVVTADSGTTIAAGTEFKNNAGQRFRVLEDATADANDEALVSVRAVSAGPDSNTAANEDMALTGAIAGYQSATSGDGLSGGTHLESDDDLRARLLFRIQNPPRGGADHDYVQWATSRGGVTRAWTLPVIYGAGTVGVAIINDDNPGLDPGQAVVDDVQQYIGIYPNQPGVAPVTADVRVFVPAQKAFNFRIALGPNTPAVQNAVNAELNDVFRRNIKPGASIPRSHFNEAISLAEAEHDHQILEITDANGDPVVGDVWAGVDGIGVLGNVNYEAL